MAMGRRKQRQESLFVSSEGLAASAGHPFHKKLNQLLNEAVPLEFFRGGGGVDIAYRKEMRLVIRRMAIPSEERLE